MYDGNSRLTSMISPAGTAGWSYFDNNRVNTRTLPNGSYSELQYNALGLLTRLTNKKQNATVLSDYTSFTYDGAFNETGLSAGVPGTPSQSGSLTFGYDTKDRLTGDASTRNGGYSFGFGYDNAFNPTTFKGATQGFNSNNQQTGTGLVWDNNGNPTTYKGSTCTFDPENRMTAYGSALTAGYRGDGLRAWSQTASGRTYYLYDGELPVAEMNSSGTITAHNIFGTDGLVSRTGGTNLYYVFDQQGNVVQRLDSSQNVTSSSTYDAYGAETNSCSPTDPFGYNARLGYYTERSAGLILCTHRYYDPAAGRWLTRDPAGVVAGANLYSYTKSAPVNNTDPLGLFTISLFGDDYEFTWEGFQEGVATGAAALGESFTFGHWQPSQEVRDRPGYGFSVGAGNVAKEALITAAGLKAVKCLTEIEATFWRYPNTGGGGLNVLKGGKSIFRIDAHPWGKPTGPFWKWPHVDVPPKGISHWPWGK